MSTLLIRRIAARKAARLEASFTLTKNNVSYSYCPNGPELMEITHLINNRRNDCYSKDLTEAREHYAFHLKQGFVKQ